MTPGPRRPQPSAPNESGFFYRLSSFRFHFGRFFRDALGVLLAAAGILLLLAALGGAAGSLLTPARAFLSAWLGWGIFVLIGALVACGTVLIRPAGPPIAWGRVFALELAALFGLGLLSIFGGGSLVRADAGLDGGRLGWAIAYASTTYLGPIAGSALLGILTLLLTAGGLGVLARLEAFLTSMAGEQLPISSAPPEPPAESIETSREKPKAERPKTALRLPREFRTDLKPSSSVPGRPAKPPAREPGLPPLSILLAEQSAHSDERTINQTAGMIMKSLAEFGIPATVIGYRVGPAVTQFAVQPGFIKRAGTLEAEDAQQMKVRVAQIANLQKDLALALSAERLRIEAPVPGKPYVGIEVPNAAGNGRPASPHTRERSLPQPEATTYGGPGTRRVRQSGRRRSGQNAAPSDCGGDRIREIRLHYSPGCLPGSQQSARRAPHGDDRLKDGGTPTLQRPSASPGEG